MSLIITNAQPPAITAAHFHFYGIMFYAKRKAFDKFLYGVDVHSNYALKELT